MERRSGRVDGLVAVVTGAASGLGLASARLLASEGATVFLTDLDSEGVHSAAEEIGPPACPLACDVRSEADWEALMSQVERSAGRLDILVNNAGIVRFGNIESCTLEDFRLQNAIMSEGVFLGCKHAIPLIARTGGGSIVNISSTAALQGFSAVLAYSAAKGAVRSMTKAIATHCLERNYGIRCNSVHPGNIHTNMHGEKATPEQAERRENSWMPLPSGSFGSARDVAEMVLYLASPASRFVTAGEFVIDNAITMTPARLPAPSS